MLSLPACRSVNDRASHPERPYLRAVWTRRDDSTASVRSIASVQCPRAAQVSSRFRSRSRRRRNWRPDTWRTRNSARSARASHPTDRALIDLEVEWPLACVRVEARRHVAGTDRSNDVASLEPRRAPTLAWKRRPVSTRNVHRHVVYLVPTGCVAQSWYRFGYITLPQGVPNPDGSNPPRSTVRGGCGDGTGAIGCRPF